MTRCGHVAGHMDLVPCHIGQQGPARAGRPGRVPTSCSPQKAVGPEAAHTGRCVYIGFFVILPYLFCSVSVLNTYVTYFILVFCILMLLTSY